MILAFDPGRQKIGFVVYDYQKGIVQRGIIDLKQTTSIISEIYQKYQIEMTLIGDGTGYKNLQQYFIDNHISFKIIEEKNSTQQARRLFFEKNPPRGLRRMLPRGLQTPAVPYDDYAAQIILEKYLQKAGIKEG